MKRQMIENRAISSEDIEPVLLKITDDFRKGQETINFVHPIESGEIGDMKKELVVIWIYLAYPEYSNRFMPWPLSETEMGTPPEDLKQPFFHPGAPRSKWLACGTTGSVRYKLFQINAPVNQRIRQQRLKVSFISNRNDRKIFYCPDIVGLDSVFVE